MDPGTGPGRRVDSNFAVVRPMIVEQIDPAKIANERHHDRPSEVPGGLSAGPNVFAGHSPYYASRVTIERQGPELVIGLGEAGSGRQFLEAPLRCIDKATSPFTHQTSGENEIDPSAIRLVRKNGVVVPVVDEWSNSSGPRPGEIAANSSAHA
jgi:hypothetical protein